MDDYWMSAEELLKALSEKMYVEVRISGKKLRLAWKELPVGSVPKTDTLSGKPVNKLTDEERNEYLKAAVEAQTLERIHAAGEDKTCFNDNIVTEEIWSKFPDRVKSQVMMKIFDLREDMLQDF